MNIVFNTVLVNALKKFDPRYLANNPMLAIVAIIASLATVLFFKEIYWETEHISLYLQLTLWLWFTVLFATFADSYAESKIGYCSVEFGSECTAFVKKIINEENPLEFQHVKKSEIKSGNLIILSAGDVVPFDGIITQGECYVNESETTGTIGLAFKTSKDNELLSAGSIIEHGESIVLKVSFAKKYSFYARVKKLVQTINRQSLPSELALQRIITGIAVLFLSSIFTIWAIARYAGFRIPLIYMLDLIVVMLPTTIAGLQYAIITFGKAKLQEVGIVVHDHKALDSIVDVNVILLDKTGTITVGHRNMSDFINTSELSDAECMNLLYLSSCTDSTNEGQNIKRYSEENGAQSKISSEHYAPLDFSSSDPISGCNLKDQEIRKGSVKAIANYLGKNIRQLPQAILVITKHIAETQGTPMLLTLNKQIIGVIHLRDRFRRGIMKQIEKIHDQGIATILITGDNKLTASYVAKKVGIKEFHANATPEKKLEFIRSLQQQGFVVAMCGDGINDVLALAQADIGITFEGELNASSLMASNIISKTRDLSAILELKTVCRKITVKRGALTVFSLASDISKYFVIVPALFTTKFPELSVLNFMNFHSVEGVVLASVMFNALVILSMIPFLFHDFNKNRSQDSLWASTILYVIGGLVSPFIFIKLIEDLLYNFGLL